MAIALSAIFFAFAKTLGCNISSIPFLLNSGVQGVVLKSSLCCHFNIISFYFKILQHQKLLEPFDKAKR
ncbi:MAG: hypothetical protein ACLRWM_05535 [Streptococcus sp.]